MLAQESHHLKSCLDSWSSPFDGQSHVDALQVESLGELLELKERVPVCLDLRKYNVGRKSNLLSTVQRYLCFGGIVRDLYFGTTTFSEEELRDIMQMISECRIERFHLNHSLNIQSIGNLYSLFNPPLHLRVLSLEDNRINAESLMLLLDAMNSNAILPTTLKSLNLNKNPLMSEGVAVLSSYLSFFQNLTSLSLSHCIATTRGNNYVGIESLLRSLQSRNSDMKLLELKGNDLNDMFFRLLNDNSTPIRVLDVSNNNFYQTDMNLLGIYVGSSSNCHIMLNDCRMDNATLETFIHGVSDARRSRPKPSSIQFSFMYNNIDCLSLLFPLLLTSPVRWVTGINLRGNPIGLHALDTAIDPLADINVASSTTTAGDEVPHQSTSRFIPPLPLLFRLLLQQPNTTAATDHFSLDLSECGLNVDVGVIIAAELLAARLVDGPPVVFWHLNLNGNHLGRSGAIAISRALTNSSNENGSIKCLGLFSNDIGRDGFVNLMNGLAENTSLLWLELKRAEVLDDEDGIPETQFPDSDWLTQKKRQNVRSILSRPRTTIPWPMTQKLSFLSILNSKCVISARQGHESVARDLPFLYDDVVRLIFDFLRIRIDCKVILRN